MCRLDDSRYGRFKCVPRYGLALLVSCCLTFSCRDSYCSYPESAEVKVEGYLRFIP